MANAASRFMMWVAFEDLVGTDVTTPIRSGFTDAQLDDFKNNWGIDGFIMQYGRIFGMGGSRQFTGTPSQVGATAATWEVQRRIRDTNIMTRLKARGMKMYLHLNAASFNYTPGYRGFFLDIWDDTAWSGTVIPNLTGIAGACQLYGIDGVDWDCEDYPQNNNRGSIPANDPQLRPSWRWDRTNRGGSFTEAETRAKMKQRGAEMTQAMSGACPTMEVGGNFIRLPMGWNAWVQASNENTDAGGPAYTDQFTMSVQMDWISGLFQPRMLKVWVQADRSAYKASQIRGGSFATGMKINHLAMMPYMSQYPGLDWDYAASRYWNAGMTWVDPGDRDEFGTPTEVSDQLQQITMNSSGENWHNFQRYFPSTGVLVGGFTYPDYFAAMKAASADRTVDTASPSISVTSSQTVGSNQVVGGKSFDDFAIWHVTWKNNRSLATGECKLTLNDLSGRPLSPKRVGTIGNSDPFGTFDTLDYDSWEMQWNATVPLSQSNDTLTFTAVDIHGLTASATITAGVPITPPSTAPTVTQNAASGLGTTTATLSGTVNPQGLATTAQFQYGPTVSYGNTTSSVAMGAGTVPATISQNLTGLTANTTYHYRLTATSSAGTTNAADGTFTTNSSAAIPVVTVGAVTGITQNQATLNGTVNPQGLDTTPIFDYGPTTAYANSTGTTPVTVLATDGTSNVTATATGLAANTLYHFRLRAANSLGTAVSSDNTFTTLAPVDPGGGGGTSGSYAAAVLQIVDLRAYWRLSETSGAVLDSKGTNTGTVIGGVTRGVSGIAGALGGAIQFNGVDGRVTFPDAPALALADGPFTLAAWVKHFEIHTESVIDKGTGAYQIEISGSDNKVRAGKSNFGWSVESSIAWPDLTAFHFLVWTYDGSQSKLYIDGVDRTGPQSNLDLVDNSLTLALASDTEGTAGRLNGVLDEIFIAASVITPQQVSDLYTLGITPESQTGVLGLLVETDSLLPVTRSGGASGGTVGDPPFYIGDPASLLRDVAVVRGEGVTTTPPLSQGDPFYVGDPASLLRDITVLRGPGTPVAGTTTIAISQVTETDTLLTPGLVKSRAVAQVAETESLFPVTKASQTRVLGLLTETDTLLTTSKGRSVGLLNETDTAIGLIPTDIPDRRRDLDVISDTNVAITAHALTAGLNGTKRTAVLSGHALTGD